MCWILVDGTWLLGYKAKSINRNLVFSTFENEQRLISSIKLLHRNQKPLLIVHHVQCSMFILCYLYHHITYYISVNWL